MERRESASVDSDASARRSWGSGDDNEQFKHHHEISSIDRSRFGFRASSRSDAASLHSDATVPVDEQRFAGFQRSHDASEEHEHHVEEEEEEEDDDDDDVRRSWTTEKEPVHDRFGGDIDLTSFRFRREQPVAVHETHDVEAEEEEKAEEEERDSDASFASLEWVTRQLRQLERRQHSLSADGVEEEEHTVEEEHTSGSMDRHVREALSLLNGGGGGDEEEQEGHEEGSWAKSAAERRGSYFDIVQEAMAVEWHRDDDFDDHRSDHEQDHDEEEEEEEEAEEEHDEEDEQQNDRHGAVQHEQQEDDMADEWLEAFTAKGRVYYYNRRTRESSWTKPASLERFEHRASTEQHHEAHEQQEEQEDDHPISDVDKQQQQQSVDYHSDHRSGQSSTSSTSSSNQVQDRAITSKPSDVTSDVLFCCFCGSQVSGPSGFQAHFTSCTTLEHHKQTESPLYTQFQQMLVLLSEDVSLRSLHYASSFPDAKPHPIGVEPPAQTTQSVRESLALLRVKHRSSQKPVVHRAAVENDNRVPSFHPVQRLSLPSSTSSKTSTKTPPSREPLVNRYASMKQKPTPVALLNTETCRHCSRSFAEGRLAKHEAVCPRVFGNEHAWGRGPSTSVQKKSSVNELDQSYSQQQRPENALGLLKKKHNANLKHTLALSFQEHQASLIECPCCRRKFAPSGAQQHIDICKTVQHRPRNPVPLLKDYALAG